MKKMILAGIIFLAASCFVSIMAQDISINDVQPSKLKIQGFNLKSDTEVTIKGTGGVFIEDWEKMIFYGWIIDSDSRNVVWHLFDVIKRENSYRESGFFDFEEKIKLASGNYELIYVGAKDNNRNYNWGMDGFNDFMNNLFNSRDRERYRNSYGDDLGISVKASGISKMDAKKLLEDRTRNAIVSINRIGDNTTIKKKFALKAETTLKLYAVGEGGRREVYDYVWIYDARNHKKVWQMEYENTNFAGGAKKNYVANRTVTLPAGSYIVSYASDDSHSFRKWNSLPPDDPQFWGVTIWPNSAKDKANVIPFKEDKMTKAMVELIKIGNNEYVSQGLKLKAPSEVRVFCLGEKGSNSFADSGWILNANTREVVWEMNSFNADYAGGGRKNQMSDEVIDLDAGEYVVYYATDDSHAYRSWNVSQPYDQDRYGITLWATTDDVKFELFDEKEYKSDKVLVEILKVRDREYLKESFLLKKDTKLRIKALGEGTDGDMHDYGWIENRDTGKIVWEMTYRNSDYAGGAKKNRLYNDTIILPKGEYRVYYESDGSHSYRDWNASPPRDQESYGISLMIEK